MIMESLNEKDNVSVSDLSKRYGVSRVAIRTDLSALEEQGASDTCLRRCD